jgi:hypothetical protein
MFLEVALSIVVYRLVELKEKILDVNSFGSSVCKLNDLGVGCGIKIDALVDKPKVGTVLRYSAELRYLCSPSVSCLLSTQCT